MAYPAVTNTFVESTTAYATAVNQNFLDIVNGVSDGTKDIRVNDVAVLGNMSLTNALTARTILPGVADTYDLGSAAGAWSKVWANDLNVESMAVSAAGRTQYRETTNYVNSDNSGYLDLHAGTNVRINNPLQVTGSAVVTGTLTVSQNIESPGITFNSGAVILATYVVGSFDFIPKGFVTSTTWTAQYCALGKMCMVSLTSIWGTSSATTFSIPVGYLPSACAPKVFAASDRPIVYVGCSNQFTNSGASTVGAIGISYVDGIIFYRSNGSILSESAWAATGLKSLDTPVSFMYQTE